MIQFIYNKMNINNAFLCLKNKGPDSEAIQDILVRMARKAGPRHLGLMGKKALGKESPSHSVIYIVVLKCVE